MRVLYSTALALLLALAACDTSDPSGPLAENTFSVRVGDGESAVRSEAHFGSYVSAETGATVAVLLGTRPTGSLAAIAAPVVGFAYDGAGLEAETYDLVPVNPEGAPPQGEFIGVYIDPAGFVAGQPLGQSGFYYTGSGTITFDEVDGTHARGTFSMRAVELAVGFAAADSVDVTGEFHAVATEAFGDEDSIWR